MAIKMSTLRNTPPFAVQEHKRRKAVGVSLSKNLFNDLVGESVKRRSWRNAHLLDTGATDVGYRRVHDALPLYGGKPSSMSGR